MVLGKPLPNNEFGVDEGGGEGGMFNGVVALILCVNVSSVI